MPAECWGCQMNIPPAGHPLVALPLEPLGACWECGVFGCRAHAERDRKSGKWLCYQTVATALAASAGVFDEPVEVVFSDSVDFSRRLPHVAEVTEPRRQSWHRESGQARLANLFVALERRPADLGLAADAIGVAEFLVAAPEGFDQGLRSRAPRRADALRPEDVLPAALAAALERLQNG